MEESLGRSDRDLDGPMLKEHDDGEVSVAFNVKGLALRKAGA
jgi:hypothetical protein